jgi:hypothetical protein
MSVHHNGVDRVLIFCHVCGKEATPDIVAELQLKPSDLFDNELKRPERPGQPQVVATYVYKGPDGDEWYRRDRRQPGKGGKDKDFLQYRMVAGKVVFGLGDVRRVPWRLPEVLQAIRDKRTIYWNEGEGCVLALEKIGEVATTSGGAQDWRPDMAEWFEGATRIVIIADNDDPGIKHARRVAEQLKPRVGEVILVRGAVDQPKADIVEHLAAGFTLDELVPLSDLHAVPNQRIRQAPQTDGTAALQKEAQHQGAASDEPAVGFNYTAVFGLPAGIQTPKNYRVNRSAVSLRRVVKEEESWIRVSFAPIATTVAYEDPDGEQSIELAWTDGSRVIRRVVARDIAKRGRELVKHLGSAGLPIIEADARLAERWLAEFETANRGLIPRRKLARNLGWQPDGTFVSSPDSGIKLEVRYDEQRVPATAFGTAGTFEAWRDAMEALAGYTVPRIVIAASFAATLLRPLGLPSFTVDVSSRSTKGKTTALQCGCSVWANPSEHAAGMSNWRGTAFAIEKRLNLVRGVPTFLDETMAVSDEAIIDYVLYQLPMNQGKDRSGGYAGALPWETILLSSGERPALSFTTAQGAAARILGTTEAPFGNSGGDIAVRTRQGILENYGHAGPAFAELLRKGLASEGGRDRLRQRHRELAAHFKGDNDMTGRRAPMVAVLALAEAMACKAGILPYEPLPVDMWVRTFTTSNLTDNRPEMAMDIVREHIAARSSELWPRPMDERAPLRGWLGAIKLHQGETRVALLPERLRGILSDAGYSLDAVLGGWIDAGYLASVIEKEKTNYRINTRFDGRVARCFVFTAKALDVSGMPVVA